MLKCTLKHFIQKSSIFCKRNCQKPDIAKHENMQTCLVTTNNDYCKRNLDIPLPIVTSIVNFNIILSFFHFEYIQTIYILSVAYEILVDIFLWEVHPKVFFFVCQNLHDDITLLHCMSFEININIYSSFAVWLFRSQFEYIHLPKFITHAADCHRIYHNI